MSSAPARASHAGLRAVTGGPLGPGGPDLAEEAARRLGLRPGGRVLDVGCGYGTSAARLALAFSAHVIALDLDPAKLAEAGQGAVAVRADARRLPLADESVDMAACECVLSLMPDPGEVLAGIARVLAPGGGLMLADIYRPSGSPAPAGPLSGAAPCCLDHAATRQELEQMARDAGLEVLAFEDHSRRLAQLAGRLVFAHGSLAAFWATMLPPEAAGRACEAAERIKPGYCLMLARKGEGHG